MGLATIERFRGFAKTTGKAVMNQGQFENTYGNTPLVWGNDVIPERVVVPFSASRTDIEPDEAAASPETSTSSAAATGEVGSSPSDYR